MASELSIEMFAPLEGERFQITIASADHAVRLREVVSLARPDGANQLPGGREPFRLIFELPTATDESQGTYTLTHPQIGAHAVFLVPVGREASNLLLEAVFT